MLRKIVVLAIAGVGIFGAGLAVGRVSKPQPTGDPAAPAVFIAVPENESTRRLLAKGSTVAASSENIGVYNRLALVDQDPVAAYQLVKSGAVGRLESNAGVFLLGRQGENCMFRLPGSVEPMWALCKDLRELK